MDTLKVKRLLWREFNGDLFIPYYLYLFEGRKEMFYLTTHSTHFIYGYMEEEEMFYLTTHSTHFIYGYMASEIW